MKSILVSGNLVKAEDQTHPLQMKLKLVLTPFTANANKTGIPQSEADNFIRTAKNQPFKINFNGMPGGHDLAYPVGLIQNAVLSELENEPIIAGDVVVWKDEFPDVAQFLEEAILNGNAHTSWEVYYDSSILDNNIEWLHGVVFAGTCVVNNPAYQGKTPILAVAEKMDERIKELETLVTTLTAERDQARAELESRNTTLAELQVQIDTLSTELTALKAADAERQQQAKEAEKARRTEELQAIGIEHVEDYLELDSTAYELVLGAVRVASKAKAELSVIKVPQLNTNTNTITAKELAKALRGK